MFWRRRSIARTTGSGGEHLTEAGDVGLDWRGRGRRGQGQTVWAMGQATARRVWRALCRKRKHRASAAQAENKRRLYGLNMSRRVCITLRHRNARQTGPDQGIMRHC